MENTTKYGILVDALKEQINSGVLKKGDKLKSENELVREFGFSRQTIRQALGILESQGVIYRKRGSGTYIRAIRELREKTCNIGVITTYISDYIFPFIINGIEEQLTPMGYHITLGVTKNKIEEETRVLKSFMNRNFDGLIVEGTKSAFPNPNVELYKKLENEGVPIVFFNSFYPELTDIPYVVTDDRKAGREVVEYLIAKGAERIGGIFKSDDIQGHRRYSGYLNSILSHKMNFDDDFVLWYTTSDEERFGEPDFDRYILERFKNCDSIVCYNDRIAARLIKLFIENGINIPRDKQIISFDNSSLSEYSSIRISGMNHPKQELGREAVKMLFHEIDTGEKLNSVTMPMNIIIKDSTK